MKFSIKQSIMNKYMSYAVGLIAKATTIEILSCLMLEATESSLFISITNFKVSLRIKIDDIEIEKPGKICVYARKLFDIVRSFTVGQELTFDTDKNNLTVIGSGMKTKFRLHTLSAEDYPNIIMSDWAKYITIDQTLLRDALKKTIFSINKEKEGRVFLCGVYFDKKDNKLNFVATDGKRLAYYSITQEEPGEFSIIVPDSTVEELLKILNEGECWLNVTENNIFLKIDNMELTSTLIEGDFPNYKVVIPDKTDSEIEVNTNVILDVIKRIKCLSGADNKIDIKFDNNKLIFKCVSDEGEANDELEIENNFITEKRFNYAYLVDVFSHIDSSLSTIKLSKTLEQGNEKPVVIKGQEENYLTVIMPMKVD